ncbi:MAG: DNA polymerase IV [Candidatus Helarchaeota archaeon]
MERKRIILHIDMDAFYANIEIRENPDYNSRPLVVGIGPNIENFKGVVSTASYRAREFGIRSGMSLHQAYLKCKSLIIVPARISYYRSVSNNIMDILRKFSDKFEKVSIDEAYIDVSNKIDDFSKVYNLILRIKNEIYNAERLTCSVGAAPNKSIAKIASGFKKPSGITIVPPDAVRSFLDPLPVKKIPGVGDKTEKILHKYNIRKIGDILNVDRGFLISLLGKPGDKIYDIALGIENFEVKNKKKRKSFGFSKSFESPTTDTNLIYDKIDIFSENLGKKINENNIMFKTISITVKYDDFSSVTKSKTLPNFTNDFNLLNLYAKKLFDELFKNNTKKVKKIGVRVSNFKYILKNQSSLKSYFV